MSNYNTLKTADTINAISIVDGAITTSKLNASVTTLIVSGSGPKVAAITYPGNDLAADPAGGQTITLTGTGFVSGCSVFVGTTQASVVTVVSATSVTFTSPALAAATYTLYLVNPDGGTATIVPGISYSGTPIWSTTAGSLASIYEYSPISNATTATGDGSISYSVFSGTLPTGSSLNTSTGVITGTSPASAGATTYTFVIRATDAQLQDSDRTFSITVNTDTVTWTTPSDNSTTTLGKDAASSTTLLATSAAGNAITYTANTLPTGLSISGAIVTGTPTVIASTTSTFTATAATTGRTATRTINWTVSVASDTYFPYTTLLLSGAAATETFVSDASVNNFALTIAGDTKPNNFNPYTPGYYSNYFDGTGDYLDAPHSTNQWIGLNQDFTIECWFNVTSSSGERVLIAKGYQGSPAYAEFGITINSSNILVGLASSSGGSWLATPTDTVAISSNTWNHVAMVRSGTTITLYRNGVVAATSTGVGAALYNHTGPIRIGQHTSGSNFTGHISNARVVIGTAVYTSAFTPPSTPLTAIANTNLLTCQSNGFVDNSANAFAITKSGDTKVNSFTPFVPNAQYATQGSTYFDGTGDYLSAPSNAAFTFGTGAFTIEAWIYPTVYGPTTGNWIYSNISAASGNSEIGLILLNAGTICLSTWNTAIATSTLTAPLNVWSHVVGSFDGTTYRLFVNGVLSGTSTTVQTLSGTGGAYIGTAGVAGISLFTGYLSNLRIVKGTAVYTGTFAVPAAPLSATQSSGTNIAAITGSQTSLLTCQTNQPASNSMFLDSSTNAFPVTRAGNTSAGTFTPYGANWSNYFNGSSYMVPATGINAAMGAGFAGNIISFEMWIFPTTFTNGADGNGIMGAYGAVSANGRWLVSMERSATTTAKLQMAYTISTGSQVNIESTASAITLNQWNHIAITVDATTAASSTIKLFANGVLLNTFTGQNMSTQTAYYRAVYIGDVQSQYVSAMVGYISNFRILKGAFAYTGNYTVPTAPLTAIANTVLLTCQSNSSVDNSANAFALSLAGPPTVQRFSPFAPQTQTAISYSGYFAGGATDYLTVTAGSSQLNLPGDFTVELWFNETNTTPTIPQFSGQTSGGFACGINSYDGGGARKLDWRQVAAAPVYGVTAITSNVWHHAAYVKSGSAFRIFLDGVLEYYSGSYSTTFTSTSTYIGTNGSGDTAYSFSGYISNFRVVKGTAVYTTASTTIGATIFAVPTVPLTAIANTALLTCQSPTFVDASTNAFVLTPSTATIKPRTLNPFGFTNASAAYSAAVYGGSAYFDGTTDYLTAPYTSSYNIALNTAFTFECWVYTSSTSLLVVASRNWGYGGGGPTWSFFLSSGITPNWGIAGTGQATYSMMTSSISGVLNQWNHYVWTRNSSNVCSIYVNGVSGTTRTDGQAMTSGSGDVFIGVSTNLASPYATGYMSNMRFVSGTAVYTSNFVPPTAPLSAITNTSLLLNMTSAGVYDAASTNNLETVADAKQVATHTPYAGSYYSNYFDGSGDVFTVSNNSGFNFSSDFIIEAWLYPTAFGQGSCNFMTHWSSGSNVYVFRVLNNARVQFLYTAGATTLTGTSTTVSLNQWSHVAVCRSGSTLRIFVNGIADTTTATYSGTLTGGGPIAVGAHNDTSEGWTGYISNLRVVNTPSAPYTTTFTPSTTPLTSITGTALLTCQSNRFLDKSANAGTITKSGHVAVQSFNPFQRNSATTMYFDGTGDALAIPYNPAFNFGAGNFTIEFWMYVTATPSTEQYFLAVGPAGSGGVTRGWRMAAHNGTAAGIYFSPTGIGSEVLLGSFPNASAWHHIAIVRNSTTITGYVDGIALGTTINASTTAITNITSGDYSFVGGMLSSGATPRLFYNGYINDLRITKGVARYTSTFTPPTTAFITK